MNNDIYNYSLEELKLILNNNNIEEYRANQIFRAIHKNLLTNFNGISNIPKSLRKFLSEQFFIPRINLIDVKKSTIDKTKKFLFELRQDKIPVETVLMEEKGRVTICVSVQSGCNVGCIFCATGYFGFKKNLSTSEILLQIYEIIKMENVKPTNIVYMGMGEPFLNYYNFLKSIKILCAKDGLGINSNKITVSTIGLKDTIRKFADDISLNENRDIRKIKLALSLHSTNNGIREKLIPVSKKNKLAEIYKELIYFYRKTKTKITYEYIYLKNINDKTEDIKRITKLSKMIPSNINVIRYHPIKQNNLSVLKSNETENDIYDFIAKLRTAKVAVNLRKSNGLDINAACGQLAAENYKQNKI